MSDEITRRGFLAGSAAAAVAAGAAAGGPGHGRATPPAMERIEAPNIIRAGVHPAIVSSRNGFKKGIPTALEMLEAGADTLDAAIAAVNHVESDPNDRSVGYGGLPNEDGVVELDSCCMHGPTNNAGAVASLQNIMYPSRVARDVLWNTDHVMLAGEGALRFARAMGYEEQNLLTESSRKAWLAWKRRLSPRDDWLEPHEKRPEMKRRQSDGKRKTGTINFNVCNAKGEVSGVTTTSGLAFKIPGRVGDSPLIGAGLYVDGKIGAAGSTGRGEAVIIAAGSHTVVEGMRAGMHPTDAALLGVRRVVEMNTMPYLWKDGKPTFQVHFYAVDVKGRVGGASVRPSSFACADAKGPRMADTAYLE